jgi:hypothetical protein
MKELREQFEKETRYERIACGSDVYDFWHKGKDTTPSMYYLSYAQWLESKLKEREGKYIEFHIEVMKEGLLYEGDKKWKDEYEPLIRQRAEKVYKRLKQQ